MNKIDEKIALTVQEYVRKRYEECEQRIEVLEEWLKEDYLNHFPHSGIEMYIECSFRDFYKQILTVADCLDGRKIQNYLDRKQKKLEDSILSGKPRVEPRSAMEIVLESEGIDIKRGLLREIKQIIYKVKNLVDNEAG